MIAPLLPSNERERLSALAAYDVLDTPPTADFDEIVELIAAICETPIAVVSLIDANRQWFKSRVGLEAVETPREISFCGHTILEPDRLTIVSDTLLDERFRDNPLVTAGPKIRFYAGTPLVTRDGFALGALCAIDTQPRDLTARQRETLRLAGRAVMMLLDQRRSIAQLLEARGEQQAIEGNLRAEIAHRRQIEQQLSFTSSHDGLTLLPNRSEFIACVKAALAELHASRRPPFAVCFIDLDRFKAVNDSLGHSAGDALLVEVGHRLMDVIRGCDTVARLGGDEFTMLIDGAATPAAVAAITERVGLQLNSKLRLDGVDICVSASIGVVLVDRTYASTEEIMRDADIAMYASKERGRNRCTIFSVELRDQFTTANELQLALRNALERDQFRLAYQPIVRLGAAHDRPRGFEALLRWKRDDGVVVSAAGFIDIAEQTGLIVELGYRVLREACTQAKHWNSTGAEDIVMAVNVSAKQIAEPGFAATVKAIVNECGLDPRLLALEVTESVLIGDADASIEIIHDLRCFGIRIYLDDFGTGYSSLSYLRRFPVDRIKIDRSFVSGGPGEGLTDPVIIHSIVSLAHKLGLKVVAEGVETQTQRLELTEMGCDSAQGFLFSHAIAAVEASALLADWKAVASRISAA